MMSKEDLKKSFPKKTESFHYAVQNALAHLPEKEETMNKKAFFKRGLAIAIAAVLVIGATVYAATGAVTQHFSSSKSKAEYTSLPNESRMKKDIGYVPDLAEKFASGYQFSEANIVNNNLKDESGTSVDKYKSITARYEKDGNELLISAEKSDVLEAVGEVAETYNGIDISYMAYTNKFVPADYELTEEDKTAQENGDLVFSYGVDEVEIKHIQSAGFVKDGIRYTLTEMEESITQEDLLEMAREIIEW